ncbi:MAG: rane-bound lytic murein transglycosylase MltF [Pseudomonadota bacterium]
MVLTQHHPLSYSDGEGNPGFERDLIELFAAEQGLHTRYIVVEPGELHQKLRRGEAHLAAAWLTASDDLSVAATNSFLESSDVLVQNEAALLIDDDEALRGKTVHVMTGSRQYATLRDQQSRIDGLNIVEHPTGSPLDLLAAVAGGRIELALVDSALLDIALTYYPTLQPGLELTPSRPIAWLLPLHADNDLLDKLNLFIDHARQDGRLARLEDRYFGHIRRLSEEDILQFLEDTRTRLPRYRRQFQNAQTATGIDWRLLAALSYQESHWDPLATSPTGVRGIMMLTEETADALHVRNRLDPAECIPAAARLVAQLKDMVASSAPEPDKTWLALSAYNIGIGHFHAAVALSKSRNVDRNSWFEMKGILPLLAQPAYYSKLKSGRARGGEAVIMVENIRNFYGILSRYEPPYHPLPTLSESMAGAIGMGGEPGLKAQPANGLNAPAGKKSKTATH